MKKKLVALMLVVVMCIAATVIPASAANYDGIDYSAVKCDWIGVGSYGNLGIYIQGDGEFDGALDATQVQDVYGVVLFATVADPSIGINLVVNAETMGWTNGDTVLPVQYDGDLYYFANFGSTSPFAAGESYSQYVPCNWGGANIAVSGVALLGADGQYLATSGTCPDSPFVAAATAEPTLPKTGVVSAIALYAMGSALIGCGAVVVKKNRKED